MEDIIIDGYQQIKQKYDADKILTYYFNIEEKKSVWELPAELIPKLQTRLQEIQEEIDQAQEATRDRTRICEPVPNSDWRIAYTHGGARFFYNPIISYSTWEIPDEVQRFLDSSDPSKLKPTESMPSSNPAQPQTSGTEMTEADVAHQLAAMGMDMDFHNNTEEEINQANKIEMIPFEERSREFKKLLQDVGTTALDLWENVLPKIIKDPRCELIPNVKDQKLIFDQYCRDFVKENSSVKPVLPKMNAQDEYRQLVEEHATTKSTWTKFNKQHFSDPRSQAVPYREREQIFVDYIKALQESKLREKEEKKQRKALNEEAFKKLLDELSLHRDSSWRKTRRLIEDDERYLAIKHDDVREDIFRDYIHNKGRQRYKSRRSPSRSAQTGDDEQEKKRKRQEESLLQRERQVRQESKSREHHTKQQLANLERQSSLAVFKTILASVIKQHDIKFQDAMDMLEKDSRFKEVQLNSEDLRQLYEEHIDQILKKREEAFRELVSSRCSLESESPPPGLLQDPIARFLGDEDELNGRFRRLQKSRIEQAKDELCQLLDENQYLAFKARAYSTTLTGEGEPELENIQLDEVALTDLEDTLSNDSRFTCLEFISEIRSSIIQKKFAQKVLTERLQVPEFQTHTIN